MNLISAILLLVHFLIMCNIFMCLFYAYVYVVYDFTFCLSVLCSLFCKHVCLSRVFVINLLTYLATSKTVPTPADTNGMTSIYS